MGKPTVVFEAYTNSDLTEGRGSDVRIALFARGPDAAQAVVGRGVMGTASGAGVREVKLYCSFEDYENERLDEVRQRALAKLSSEELAALGWTKDGRRA